MENISLTDLHKAISKKYYSITELTQYYLKRIEKTKFLNAYISVNNEYTLLCAAEADNKFANNNNNDFSLLFGLPIAHKDTFVTREWPSTAGSKMLENYYSPFDATIVEKFNKEGTVCLGKTNMDEFAMGSSNENSYFGATKNPWDYQATSGGSSGGSAVAVAAGLCIAATGTDTGGSIRQPAAFTGITGIKPTYGRVSRYGIIAFASSLDQAGPMARSALDCAYMLSVMAGMDKHDATSLNYPKEDFSRYIGKTLNGDTNFIKPLSGLRIGLPQEYFSDGLSSDVRTLIEQALSVYRTLGATLIDVSLPMTELSIPVYYIISSAEASANLARFDGVRFGYRANNCNNINDLYKKSRTEAFGTEVKNRILIGTYVLSKDFYDDYYLQAQCIRRLITQNFQEIFTKCDILMGPVTPTVAWDLGNKKDDLLSMYLADIYTVSVNLAGLPGMSIPCGFGNKNRPVGLQIIGNYFMEARMLQIAHAFQSITNWHNYIPQIKYI